MDLTTRSRIYDKQPHERLAMTVRKHERPAKNGRQVPIHPNYQDEIGPEAIDAIRKLADPDGKRAASRVLLYPVPC